MNEDFGEPVAPTGLDFQRACAHATPRGSREYSHELARVNDVDSGNTSADRHDGRRIQPSRDVLGTAGGGASIGGRANGL